MLSYVIVGANDIPRSERFYTAVLEPLGYEKTEQKDAVSYTLPDIPDRFNGPGAVYVTKPYDGREATVGNGSMLAFRVPTYLRDPLGHKLALFCTATDRAA
jgi:catechol 2,3-dioxygenase-like lactoylglutathione lyase family enzyme